MSTAEIHVERLLKSGRGRIYSGETSYGVEVLQYDSAEDRVQVRFDSTRRVDWYPRGWVYASLSVA